MGKNKTEKGKAGKYAPKINAQTGNKARESEERKMFLRNKIEMKRLASNVEKAKSILKGDAIVPAPKDSKKDSLYELKGAARPAAEFYAPKVEPVEKRDLLEEYKHNLWDIQEGKDYLTAQFEYATALHNLMNKSRDAITIFEEMIDLDKEDHMRAKEQILRCYLDQADAVNARNLLEKYSTDKCSFFMYSRALIEYLSWNLKEPGATKEICDEALKEAIEANPYLIWALAYNEIFEPIIEDSEDLLEDIIQENLNKPGSVEEAFTFIKNDGGIWLEIEGIVDWILEYLEESELVPPEVNVVLPEEPLTEESSFEEEMEYFHAMYLDMFKTGCEEIEQRLLGNVDDD